VEVLHSGLPGISKTDLKAKLAKMYKVDNSQLIVVFGLQTAFGGGRTKGFGLIYDTLAAAKKYESKYRRVRVNYFYFLFVFIFSRSLFDKNWCMNKER
jgi:small subunit ribosomal protein S24e